MVKCSALIDKPIDKEVEYILLTLKVVTWEQNNAEKLLIDLGLRIRAFRSPAAPTIDQSPPEHTKNYLQRSSAFGQEIELVVVIIECV